MIISSGQMEVYGNKNRKTVKFFGEVQDGDIIEVRVNLNVNTTYRVSDKLVTVHNITQDTKRTDAPTYINAGLEKLDLKPIVAQGLAEYERGYQEAVSVLKDAYTGGYIEDYLFEDNEQEQVDALLYGDK